jgi:hypothetical protein
MQWYRLPPPRLSLLDMSLDVVFINLTKMCSFTGTDPSKPTLVAIKGTVFDVTGNASYDPVKGPYRGMHHPQPLLPQSYLTMLFKFPPHATAQS